MAALPGPVGIVGRTSDEDRPVCSSCWWPKLEIRWGGVRQKRAGQRKTPRPLHAHFWWVFKKWPRVLPGGHFERPRHRTGRDWRIRALSALAGSFWAMSRPCSSASHPGMTLTLFPVAAPGVASNHWPHPRARPPVFRSRARPRKGSVFFHGRAILGSPATSEESQTVRTSSAPAVFIWGVGGPGADFGRSREDHVRGTAHAQYGFTQGFFGPRWAVAVRLPRPAGR